MFEPLDIVDAAAVQAAAAAAGIFPLVTDLPVERLCALEMLQTYKYQAFIEKRHEQLKTAAEVVPVNFKNPERIEAFLFLYFLAITLHGLIERQVRRSMKERKLPSLPLYPEERKCRAPTADKIIHFFQPLRAYRLSRRNVTIQNFADPLSDLHRLILELLEIPHNAYTAGACDPSTPSGKFTKMRALDVRKVGWRCRNLRSSSSPGSSSRRMTGGRKPGMSSVIVCSRARCQPSGPDATPFTSGVISANAFSMPV